VIRPLSRGLLRASSIVALLAVGGCGAARVDDALARMVTEAERDLAVRLVTLLQRGRIEDAQSLMWMSEFERAPDGLWLGLSESLRGIAPEAMRLVDAGVQIEGQGSIRTVAQTYEALASDGWRQVHIVSRAGRAAGFHVQGSERSLVEHYGFRSAPVTTEQATAVLWGLSAWIVAFGAAAKVIRVRMPGRWLWAALSFVMLGRVSVNWTTGESALTVLAVFAPPTHWMKAGLITPWVLSVGVPVFAMVAWRKAAAWERAPRFPEPEGSSPGRWAVYRSTPEGGRTRLAAYSEKSSAEAHMQRLRSAGLDVEYWVEDEESEG